MAAISKIVKLVSRSINQIIDLAFSIFYAYLEKVIQYFLHVYMLPTCLIYSGGRFEDLSR